MDSPDARPPSPQNQVVTPRLSRWKFFEAEDRLRETRNAVPNLRLANTARRHLADLVESFGNQHGLTGQQVVADIEARDAQRLALTQLGLLGVKASSAAILLVTCGYAGDAAVHLRRIIECGLRSRAALADQSGENARQWLSGRARPSAERLAQKFGEPEDLRLLSISAHADARGMAFLRVPDLSTDDIPTVTILPRRNPVLEKFFLYGVSYECGTLAVGLAEAFNAGVHFPGWLMAAIREAGDDLRNDTSQGTA